MTSQPNYPPLADIRKSLRIKWYRCPIETSKLHHLLERSDKQGLFQAGGHFLLWILSATTVYLCASSGYWLWLIPVLFCHGVIASFLKGTSVHELGHGTVFKTPWLNKFFLYLFSTLSWWDHFDYASSHTYHHRYTLHPVGDRENLLPLSPAVGRVFLLQMFTFNLYTEPGRTFGKGGFVNTVLSTIQSALGREGSQAIPSNAWLSALHKDQPTEHKKSTWWSRWLLVFHVAVVLFSLASGQLILILIVTCGCFFSNIVSYLLGMTQHCGLKINDSDFRKSVRSIKINPVLEFLYWRMNWHTEHHMFAGVPCYNLKELHEIVKNDMPQPRSLKQAWKEMTDTWQAQKSEPDYFFDTPVPQTTIKETADSKLHSSIGELAPEGLR